MSWLQIKKNTQKQISFCSVIFSFALQQQQTFSWSDCDMQWKVDFIWQPVMTSSVIGARIWSKALPKAKLTPKKKKRRSWSLLVSLLPVWTTTAFWMLVKPLHLRSMLSKSIRCTKNCNACSWHWSTERAQFFFMTIPDCRSHNQHFKCWMNCATELCLFRHVHLTLHQMITTSSSILTALCRENASTTSRNQKCFQRVCWIPEHRFLCCRNNPTYFLLAKMCWL